MSGPIQLIPPGLLGLFQLKTMGRNPSELGEQVIPTLEMFKWYLMTNQREQLVQSAAGITTVGYDIILNSDTLSAMRVPPNQWWYVHSFDMLSDLIPAGQSLIFRLAWQNQGSSSSAVHYPGEIPVSVTGGGAGVIAFSHAADFWLPPGSTLGVSLTFASNPRTLTGSVQYTALPV